MRQTATRAKKIHLRIKDRETQIDGGRRVPKNISCNPEIHRQRRQQMEGQENCQRIKMGEKKIRDDVKQMIRTFLASHHHPTFIFMHAWCFIM